MTNKTPICPLDLVRTMKRLDEIAQEEANRVGDVYLPGSLLAEVCCALDNNGTEAIFVACFSNEEAFGQEGTPRRFLAPRPDNNPWPCAIHMDGVLYGVDGHVVEQEAMARQALGEDEEDEPIAPMFSLRWVQKQAALDMFPDSMPGWLQAKVVEIVLEEKTLRAPLIEAVTLDETSAPAPASARRRTL